MTPFSDPRTEHVAQANYFRDPSRVPQYLLHGERCPLTLSDIGFVSGSLFEYLPLTPFNKCSAKFLPDINNEKNATNATYKSNFLSLESLALVKALNDRTVIPKESEWCFHRL